MKQPNKKVEINRAHLPNESPLKFDVPEDRERSLEIQLQNSEDQAIPTYRTGTMSDKEDMYEIIDRTDRPNNMPISITQNQQTRNHKDMTMSFYSRGLTSEKFRSVQPLSESEE